MPPKAKKPTTPGKKEEKGEAKKPLQEKKPDNAPAKAKKEGAAKPAPKKKDPAPKPAAGADAGKGKDKSKKRKLNETKPKAANTDAKKKKVEKKVQGKTGTAAPKGKKPVKKQMASKVKSKTQKRRPRRRRPARKGKQEIIVYEGRRYFLLPSGKIKAMLDIKLEENDKVTKVDGVFIKKTDAKAFEEYKESIKSLPATTIKRKLKLKLQILRRNMMKDLLKEAKVTNKPSLATAKDASREVKVTMTLFRDTWVRKKAVPRLVLFVRNKTIKIKAARKEKGPKELTEAEQKTLQRFTRKILQLENLKLRQALLCKRPSVAAKQKSAKPAKKPAKKPAPSKAAASKAGGDKKQKRPAKKAAN